MHKITKFAVEYPVTVSMFVLAIILLGYISMGRLGVDLFPDLNAPRIFIEIKAGERPPEEIEKQYVENIESQVTRQKGVTNVHSVCMVGMANITVEYNWGTDMDGAFLDLQKALGSFSQNSEIEEFNISQHNPNASPVMLIGISHPEISDMDELRKVGENYIRNELIRLEGIADVVLTGIEEKEVIIETDQYRMKAYGVTPSLIVQQIQSLNRNASGGSIVEMGKKYIIKGTSIIEDVSDIGQIIISYKNQEEQQNVLNPQGNPTFGADKVPVFLKDLASVKLINKKPQNFVRINGKRCMGLSVYKETGFNTVKAVEDLTKALDPIKKSMTGYEFTVIQDQGKFISNAVKELRNTAIIGAVIAVFVLFLFLRRIGLTLIVSCAIPVSVIATFNLMYFNGLTINVMTLGGLALGAGMLVDNAIVVMENIFRMRENGLSVKEAAIQGTAKVGGAIISSTLTTIVVFLPIVYLHGASGELFKDQAWTVAFSLLASLFVGILFIPMIYQMIYGKKPGLSGVNSVRLDWFGTVLSKIINRRFVVLAVAAAILVLTVLILPLVGKEFVPKAGSNEFSIGIKLAEGTRIERTSETVANLEKMVLEAWGGQIDMIYSTIGPDKTTKSEKSLYQDENSANLKIRLKNSARELSGYLMDRIVQMASEIPDAEITVLPDETALNATLGTEGPSLMVEIKGKELDVIEELSILVKKELEPVPGLLNLRTSIEKGAPEIDLVIDRFRAGAYNLSASDITNQLQDILSGKDAGKFEKAGEMSDIRLKMPEISLSQLNELQINAGDKQVPVYEVSTIRQSWAPKQIIRTNQNRVGIVSADISGEISFDRAVQAVSQKLDSLDKPLDYEFSITGQEKMRKDAMSNLSFAFILSIILVYMVLASQFESFVHPFTILLTIPLAVTGSVWAFFILGKSLNIMAFIGIIMLAGIAVNNSILLVDAINQFRTAGNSLRESIIMAGQNRIRPILMTSLTTILALLPLTIGIGESASLRSPMAIAVIAGLFTSTIMSLVVIPCLYYIFESWLQKFKVNQIVAPGS
jgi:hydrophobic/amphiphilic exporter-1 (mainly G- bacteria), HAE1 family